MHYCLTELLDIPLLQKLLEHFSNINGMVAAILDPDGEVLLSVGWQEICTKFHRACPQTACRCRQSDNYFKEHLHENSYIVYKCLNGLSDCAVPITINNHHLGTFFTGQFLSEPPDEQIFRRQALEYGFDESAYINALRQVPVISERDVELTMEFCTQLTRLLSAMGLQRMNQLEAFDEKIRIREERLRLALEGSDNGFWDWNIETGHLYYSPSWHRMLGYTEGEIEPSLEGWAKLIKDDVRSYLIKCLNDHIQGGNSSQYEVEYQLLTKSGEWKWVHGIGKIVAWDQYDRPLRMTGLTTDIDERKMSEKQLQEERNFNVALVDTAGDLIVVTDHENRIILFNQVCEQVSGYSFNEVKGKYIWELLVPEDIEHSQSLLALPMLSWDSPGLKLNFENRWLTRDGKRRLIKWTTTFLSNEQGTINYVISAGSDITQQRFMEERLRKSEAEMRSLFQNVNGIIYTLSHGGRLNFVSPGWTELLGHSIDEVKGRVVTKFIHPDDIKRGIEFFERVKSSGETHKGLEYRVKHRDGSWRWHNSSITTVKDADGNQSYYVGIAIDVTDRKNAEEEIRYLSFYDRLTGLYNRAFFEEEFKRMDTERQLPICLIMGDVNGLKLINDSMGHQEGDKLLITAAGILKRSCRKEDIVARWGGDEFIILLPGCDSDAGARIVEQIQDACKNDEDLPIEMSISLGLACKNYFTQDIQEIIKEAEDKMYRNKLLETRSTRSAFINALEKTLWTRSHETKEHCMRMQEMALKIGNMINLSDSELNNLKLLAHFHDIGKISIPNSILDKPGKCSLEEWENLKRHPEIGYRIALSSPELAPIAEGILFHHERWDGYGYPFGIKGEEIPLMSRIITVVDTYDVLINGRAYQKSVSPEEAWNEIARCAGGQFDPELVSKAMALAKKAMN